MGFWPYFLQAHESDGGYVSPLLLDPSTSPIGIVTTLFFISFLFLGDGSSVFVSSQEEGEAGAASDMGSGSGSSGSVTYNGLVLNLRLYMINGNNNRRKLINFLSS